MLPWATHGLRQSAPGDIKATRRLPTMTSTDRIEKRVLLRAPRSRVWRALSSIEEFNSWFGVKLVGELAPGKTVRGKLTNPKYEHLSLELVVDRVEPEHFFSYRW